jgi:O-antigen/teichoic acid export membrane protein
MTKLVAQYSATGDHAMAGRVASTARVVYGLSAVAALMISSVLALNITRWFDVPSGATISAPIVLVLVGASVGLGLLTSLYGGILAGVRRLDLVGLAGMILELARVPLVLLALASGHGIVALSSLGLLLTIARLQYHKYAAKKAYPELKVESVKPSRDDIRAILDISAFSTAIYALSTVSSQGMIYVLGAQLSVAAIGAFAIGGTLPQYVSSLTLPIAQHVLSEASHLNAQAKQDALWKMLMQTGRIGAVLIFAPLFGFWARGKTFLGLWMGEYYREASGTLLYVFSIAAMANLSRHVIQTTFIARGEHRSLIRWYGLETAAILGLGFVLVSKAGNIGGAWAQVLPSTLLGVVVLPILLARAHKRPCIELYANWFLRPALALVPFFGALLLTDRAYPAPGYLAFFSQIALCVPLGLAGGFWVALDENERKLVISKMRALFHTSPS